MKAIFSLTAPGLFLSLILGLILTVPANASEGQSTSAQAVTVPTPVQAVPVEQPSPRLLAWDRVGSPVSSLSSFT